MYQLFSYFRSSASYRVRIALNLKNIPYEITPIHLLNNGGEQFSERYREINPQTMVPSLVTPSDQTLTQSIAIIEYLEESHPEVPLLPKDNITRAKIRAFAQVIACDIHPLNNLRVLKYLKHELHIDDAQKNSWYFKWLESGFYTLETLLKREEKKSLYCFGDEPSLADICLVPQIYNAERFAFSLEPYPLLKAVNQRCLTQPAFIKALPENQKDAI